MVINPEALLGEMETLRQGGISITPDRLRISHAAHLITPGHLALDEAQEKARGAASIGTTLRGIGPAYTDKVARRGLRFGDMRTPEQFGDAVVDHIDTINQRLQGIYQAPPLDPRQVAAAFVAYARRLTPYIADISNELAEALTAGKRVLAEGAQGTLLDLDHGTYPFVTSSHPTVAGVLLGLGLGIGHVGRVIGVTKAFQTRVGAGPFPSEIEGEAASHLRGTGENPWDEFGTTTGRPRRVGWLDLVLLRYAIRINGFTELALTKLDVLTGLESLKLCVAYQDQAQRVEQLPFGPGELAHFRPVYEEMPGWDLDVMDIRHWADLPANARGYITRIETLTGLPVTMVSVGPERSQIVLRGEKR
jgi:adenylosuccinate synthase